MKTLKSRMLAVLIPLIMLSLLLTSTMVYKVSRDKIKAHILKGNETQAVMMASDVGNWLGQFFTVIDMAARTEHRQLFDDNTRVGYMADLMKMDSALSDVYFGMETGRILNGSGWVAPKDYDPRKRPWYNEAVTKGMTSFGQPYLDAMTKETVVAVASPIKNPDGSIKGVLAADIQLSGFTEKLKDVKVGETGYSFIMTKEGVIISHPNPELIGKNGNLDLGKDIQLLTQAVMAQKQGTYEYVFKNERKIATYDLIPNTDWKLIVTMPMKELTKELNGLTYFIAGSTLIFSLIATMVVIFITRRITTPIVALSRATQGLANGDLSMRASIQEKNEIGSLAISFNAMADNLTSLVGRIAGLTQNIHEVSNHMSQSSLKTEGIAVQIAQASTDLAKGAETQSMNVASGVSKINSMTVSIQEIDGSINTVYLQTEAINDLVRRGEEAITVQNHNMKENLEATHRMNSAINELDEKTKEIRQIVGVIDGIASQTNLLALNASIEAARAGEQGRGFSVVADEIRKLAEQSTHSTGKIADSIKEIINRTQSAVEQALVAENAVKEQEASVGQVVGIFKDVQAAIHEMTDRFDEVKKRSSGIQGETREIKEAIHRISEVIDMNAASSEEVAASTEVQVETLQQVTKLSLEVEKAADELYKAIRIFKV